MKKILLICILMCLSYNESYASDSSSLNDSEFNKKIVQTKQVNIYYLDRMKKFDYRARTKYLLLGDEDLSTIDIYYDILFKAKIQKEHLNDQTAYNFRKFFEIINSCLIQNKIPIDYLDKLRTMLVALNSFITVNNNYFNQRSTLWLIEYRSIANSKEANKFLNDMMTRDKSQKEIVLKILKNDNKHQQIESWFQKKEIPNFNAIIEITRRQDSIVELFNRSDKSAIDSLIKDYQITIKQIFESHKPKNKYSNIQYLLFEHVDWIFLQLNRHKKLPEIQDILVNLNEDFLIFNDDAIIENLPKDLILTTFESIYHKLGIFWKVGEINKLFLSTSFTSNNSDHKLLIKYKNKLREYVYNKVEKFL